MSESEESNYSFENTHEELKSSQNLTDDEAADQAGLEDDPTPRITAIVDGDRPGSKTFNWEQNGLHFYGFARAPRSKKKPNEWTIMCHSVSLKTCKFSFKAFCPFDKNTVEWCDHSNWETVKGQKFFFLS